MYHFQYSFMEPGFIEVTTIDFRAITNHCRSFYVKSLEGDVLSIEGLQGSTMTECLGGFDVVLM